MVLFASFTTFAMLVPALSVGARSIVPQPAGLQTRQAQLPPDCEEFCSPLAGCLCITRPTNCLATYTVDLGENCGTIVSRFNNFTATELFLWNPEIRQTCLGLRAYVPVCINVSGYKFNKAVAAGDRRTPDSIPVPVQTVVPQCTLYEYVDKAGLPRFGALLRQNNITQNQWNQWNEPNSDPNDNIPNLAGYFSCVKASSRNRSYLVNTAMKVNVACGLNLSRGNWVIEVSGILSLAA